MCLWCPESTGSSTDLVVVVLPHSVFVNEDRVKSEVYKILKRNRKDVDVCV